MIIPITREIKITLLKSLKQGYIDTLDIVELRGEQANFFLDLLMESNPVVEEPTPSESTARSH